MRAMTLGERGDTVIIAYDTEAPAAGLSATETFIERERAYSRSGRVLAEAILYRGPTPHFWESVRALQRMTDEWAIHRDIVGGVVPTLNEPRLLKWSYDRARPWALLVPYPALREIGTVFDEWNQTDAPVADLAPVIPSPLLTAMYAENTDRASSAGLSTMFDYLLTLQSQDQVEQIDDILATADVTRLAPEFMVGLLRVNFLRRSMLHNWTEYLSRVDAELSTRNLDDVPRILQGLYRP